MVQQFPYVIKGIANLNGTLQSGITVTIKNNTKNQTGTWATDSAGEFAASLSDPVQFSSGYDVGDSITVSCSFAAQTITVPSGAGSTVGGQEVDLIAENISEIGSESLSYAATIPLTETSTETSASGTISLTESSPESFSYSATIPLTQVGAQSFSYTVTIPLTQTGSETSFIANVSLPLAEVASETSTITNISFPLVEIAAETAQTGLANIAEVASTLLTWMATIPLNQVSSELFSYYLTATVSLTESSTETPQLALLIVAPTVIVTADGKIIVRISVPTSQNPTYISLN